MNPLLDAMKKNYTQEEQKKVIDGLKDSKVVQDIGIPDEIKDLIDIFRNILVIINHF